MKAIWKGSLLIGKLEIPVKLYAAVEAHSLGFRLVHAKCHTPLNYQRICPKCKKKIAWNDVDKAMELADGSFFIITPEKLETLKPESLDEITIKEFVEPSLIAPIYYNAHYYLAPTKVTEKAYFLLVETMQELNKTAIATFVMKEKDHVCAISAYQHALLLSTLNYSYEIRPIERVEELSVKVAARVSKKEEELAEKLVKKMSSKKFDISAFHDTFAEKLREQIKRSAAGKKLLKVRAQKAVKEHGVSLLESLEESVAEKKPARAKSRR
ncbi:MAG: Ku protein [Candidatus Babeliales bacterium]